MNRIGITIILKILLILIILIIYEVLPVFLIVVNLEVPPASPLSHLPSNCFRLGAYCVTPKEYSIKTFGMNVLYW